MSAPILGSQRAHRGGTELACRQMMRVPAVPMPCTSDVRHSAGGRGVTCVSGATGCTVLQMQYDCMQAPGSCRQ
eukprot:10069281-Alexandrium_andersonii.AAC.1